MDFLKLFSANEREIKRFRGIADQINAFEPSMKTLSDEQLRAKTDEFKARYRAAVDVENLSDEERKQASSVTRLRLCCPKRSRWSEKRPCVRWG